LIWFNAGDAGGEYGSNVQCPTHRVKLESGRTAPEISIPLKNDSYSSSVAPAAAMPLIYADQRIYLKSCPLGPACITPIFCLPPQCCSGNGT